MALLSGARASVTRLAFLEGGEDTDGGRGTDASGYGVRIARFARLQRIRVIGKPTEVTANPMAKQTMATACRARSVNRRGIFTPDRRAIETPLIDGVERVGDRSCVA